MTQYSGSRTAVLTETSEKQAEIRLENGQKQILNEQKQVIVDKKQMNISK